MPHRTPDRELDEMALERLDEIQKELRHLHDHAKSVDRKLDDIHRTQETIMAVLDDLKAAVARNTDTTKSAIAALVGIKKALDDIIANGNADPALAALSASITADDDALAQAIVDNTPAAP